jgi:hypothetical protein
MRLSEELRRVARRGVLKFILHCNARSRLKEEFERGWQLLMRENFDGDDDASALFTSEYEKRLEDENFAAHLEMLADLPFMNAQTIQTFIEQRRTTMDDIALPIKNDTPHKDQY